MAGVSKWTGNLFELTGDKELDRKLKELSKTVQTRIAKPAIRAALQVVAKAQKAAAPSKEIRKAIGYRLNKKGRDTDIQGKAGVAVGKKAPKAPETSRSRPGVGLGLRNVHWFVLGTGARYTGSTSRAKGRRGLQTSTGKRRAFRGRIKPQLFLKAATQSAWPNAIAAAAEVAREKLALEVAK